MESSLFGLSNCNFYCFEMFLLEERKLIDIYCTFLIPGEREAALKSIHGLQIDEKKKVSYDCKEYFSSIRMITLPSIPYKIRLGSQLHFALREIAFSFLYQYTHDNSLFLKSHFLLFIL